ncbi:MAG: pilus assembly PilX N-terminal domain-containing protein [Patescibacteria group bacterium]
MPPGLRRQRSGMELTMVIVIMGMITAISLALLQMVGSQNTLSNREIRQQQIFQIAEAGVNYYRWRLAHYPEDYQDGTGVSGPYVHDFKDATGQTVGRYELSITPPVTGSTIATIRSSGYLLTQPNARRTITVKLGIPSLSKYAVVANANMRFGAGTEIFGPVHANGGIHFDGVAHGLVSSAQTTYTDPDGYGTKPGVWSLNPDASTFLGGKQFPVPPIDFNGITIDLATLKALATAPSGLLLPLSGAQGYHLTFRTDDKVDIRRVVSQLRCQYRTSTTWRNFGYCSNNFNNPCSQDSTCGTGNTCILSSFSIGTRATDQTDYQLGVPLPANGVIFVPEDAWVDGTIDSARVTVVAAAEPLTTGQANIYINNDLKYTNTDGRDAIGLIAQNNILTGFFSENDIIIDAALIAQKGRVGRSYYGSWFIGTGSTSNFQLSPTGSPLPNGGGSETNCRDFRKRTNLTTLGSMATNQRYGFAWTGSLFSCGGGLYNGSGYCNRFLNFDSNLIYAPPPSFPTSGEYSIISYTEQ